MEGDEGREPADELRNHPELDEVGGFNLEHQNPVEATLASSRGRGSSVGKASLNGAVMSSIPGHRLGVREKNPSHAICGSGRQNTCRNKRPA